MKKIRPAIIVNDDALGVLPLKIIVPITDWKSKFSKAPWMIKLEPSSANGLTKVSSADCFQVRSVSIDRFERKLGDVSLTNKSNIKTGLMKVLSLM